MKKDLSAHLRLLEEAHENIIVLVHTRISNG